jgi:hypothetical protein
MLRRTSKDSLRSDEEKLVPGIGPVFLTRPIEIFFDRDEVFFQELFFENFANELALVLVSNFYTDPAE